MAARRLHALSPKGRSLVSDVLPEEYDYVRMTMRQLVFSLPEAVKSKKKGSLKIQSPDQVTSSGHEALVAVKRKLDFKLLDSLRVNLQRYHCQLIRSLRRYWDGLEGCCRRRVIAISARDYHKCLLECDDWDVIMSVHMMYDEIGVLEYDEEKDVYTLGEQLMTSGSLNNLIDAFRSDTVHELHRWS
jgi:hypothetical protein